jgi:hypothetical protein
MKPVARASAAVIAALLGLGAAGGGHAQQGAPPPDAGWGEQDYLLHYAAVVCLQGAYGALEPPASPVLKALGREAWAMVERTRQKPETYDAIHTLAMAHGRQEAPERALAGCNAWVKGSAAEILKHADIPG